MLYARAAQFEDADSRSTLQSREPFSKFADTQGSADDLALQLAAQRPRQLRFLRSRLPSLQDAEDAWQDGAIKFLQHAESLCAAERPQTWMDVSLRRLVVDRYRRAAVQRRTLHALANQPPPDAADAADATEELVAPIDCLKTALHALKPEYREILAATSLEDRPLKEVARDLELTANNAAVRVHRARNALRQAMAEKCPVCPLADCWAKDRVEKLLQT